MDICQRESASTPLTLDLSRVLETSQILQDHYEEPFHRGGCEGPTGAAEGEESATGCQIRVEVLLENETLEEIWWDGRGCVCCEGFASLMASECENKPVEELNIQPLLTLVGGSGLAPECLDLSFRLLLEAIQQTDGEDDWSEAGDFGGPSLGEEC
ncbi:MAG: iron-sulfur cluster assembly scaffold protein [Planctomycetota bacterium]